MIVVFEGISGGGKATMINRLADHFSSLGLRKSLQYEISSLNNCAPQVANLLERAHDHPFASPERNALYWAARIHHDAITANKARKSVDLMLVDGSWGSVVAFSSLMYFGISSHDQAFWDTYPDCFLVKPDLTLLFDLPVSVAQAHKKSPALLDTEVAERVRQRYLDLARRYHWQVIDASRGIEVVESDCIRLIQAKMSQVPSILPVAP